MTRAKRAARTRKEDAGEKDDAVERPAVVAPDHARDRVLGLGAGAKKGWSRLTVYEREFRKGALVCRERCTGGAETQAEMRRALDRYEAARAFDEGWQVCAASWPGSSGFDRVKGGGGVPGAFVDHQRDVKDYWGRVEAAMGANDWLIVRRVCGENYSVAQAVAAISPGYKLSTLARFREALDALVGRGVRWGERQRNEKDSHIRRVGFLRYNQYAQLMPWIVAAVLAVMGFIVPTIGPKLFGLSAQDNAVLSGALGGALIGASGALFALLIMDFYAKRAAARALERRVQNLKKLIAAELVNVATGMISAKQYIDIAIQAVQDGGSLPGTENLDRITPRAMPFTDSLGPDLLILDPDTIDALVTLKANMERTAESMEEVSSGRWLFGLLAAQQISEGIAHDMNILAQCFELVAPNRKLAISLDSKSRPTPDLLRDYSSRNIAKDKIGVFRSEESEG